MLFLVAVCFLASLSGAEDNAKGAAPPLIFSSHYTDLQKECSGEISKQVFGVQEGDGDIPWTCPPFKGYRAAIHYSATSGCLHIRRLGPPQDKYETDPPVIACDRGTALTERKLEWRLANGLPFAVIIRYTEWDTRNAEPKNLGERLAVKGLTGFEPINASIDTTKDPGANEAARKRADDGYRQNVQKMDRK